MMPFIIQLLYCSKYYHYRTMLYALFSATQRRSPEQDCAKWRESSVVTKDTSLVAALLFLGIGDHNGDRESFPGIGVNSKRQA